MGRGLEVFAVGCVDTVPARAFAYGNKIGRVVFRAESEDAPAHLDILLASRSSLAGQQVTGSVDELIGVFADAAETTWLLESLAVPPQVDTNN